MASVIPGISTVNHAAAPGVWVVTKDKVHGYIVDSKHLPTAKGWDSRFLGTNPTIAQHNLYYVIENLDDPFFNAIPNKDPKFPDVKPAFHGTPVAFSPWGQPPGPLQDLLNAIGESGVGGILAAGAGVRAGFAAAGAAGAEGEAAGAGAAGAGAAGAGAAEGAAASSGLGALLAIAATPLTLEFWKMLGKLICGAVLIWTGLDTISKNMGGPSITKPVTRFAKVAAVA